MTEREQKVVDLMKAIETKDEAAIAVISRERYVQHNPNVADDFAGFKGMVDSLPPGHVKVDTYRVFEDGDYVVAHSQIELDEPLTVFDIFRFEGDKIVEHWDNLQPIAEPNPAGRTPVDGPTQPIDLDKTAANKKIARGFVEDVLKGAQLEKVSNYVAGDNYVQHHPLIGDGPEALKTAFRQWAEEGITVRYDTIHHVLGKGNFVLVASEGEFNAEPTAFYDLFRIEEGCVAEHWDAVQGIPPQSARQNGNGKF